MFVFLFFGLNPMYGRQALQADKAKLRKCRDYLHYLLKGLEALPPHKEPNGPTVVWRGIDRSERNRCNITIDLSSETV